MAEVILQTIVDAKRPTLRIQALSERIGPAGMGVFFATHAVPLLQERAKARFANEGDDASGHWKPLAESTIKRREAKGQVPLKVNDRTGKMKEWVTNSPGRIFTTKGVTKLEWPGTAQNRTTSKKLKVAQMGLMSPFTHPRPVVAVDQADLLTILVTLEEWIDA